MDFSKECEPSSEPAGDNVIPLQSQLALDGDLEIREAIISRFGYFHPSLVQQCTEEQASLPRIDDDLPAGG